MTSVRSASTTPKVQYGHVSGSANTIRPTTITYPNGRVITYGYGASDSVSDALSRIGAIIDDDAGATHLADYSYLGAGLTHGRMPTLSLPLPLGEGRGEGFLVEADYTEPDIEYTLVGTAGGNDPDTGDIYRGLDRFGRVKDCYWYNYGTSTDVDRIKYGYDRNGNRLWRENVVARSYGKYFDEKYVYDLVDRLKTMDRGELDDLKSQIGNLQFAQRWGLDATGNWRSFLEDSDGDASWDLDQTRTSNKVNEVADINESTGPSWATPVYNRPGNMTTIPKPADPTQSFTATYDAWNRLVKLEHTSGTVAQYEYDGAKRRTVKKTYVSGLLNETRHLYDTEPSRWQVVEERVGTSTNPDRQFVWGLRYIDDLILRDRDTNDDGALDERLYGIQDANWNSSAVIDCSGTAQERYVYDAYGTAVTRAPTFDPRYASTYRWDVTFAGYRWDSESALLHVRRRLYSPRLGWAQRDPVMLAWRPQLYEYAASNPTNSLDPLGEAVNVGAGFVAGCILGALGSVVGMLIKGGIAIAIPPGRKGCPTLSPVCDIVCPAIGGCIGGGLAGAIIAATGNPNIGSCLGSLAGGIAEIACLLLLKCKSLSESLCDVIAQAANTLVACAAGFMIPAPNVNIVKQTFSQVFNKMAEELNKVMIAIGANISIGSVICDELKS
jgi:RHS repeat-associated protein